MRYQNIYIFQEFRDCRNPPKSALWLCVSSPVHSRWLRRALKELIKLYIEKTSKRNIRFPEMANVRHMEKNQRNGGMRRETWPSPNTFQNTWVFRGTVAAEGLELLSVLPNIIHLFIRMVCNSEKNLLGRTDA